MSDQKKTKQKKTTKKTAEQGSISIHTENIF